MDAETNTPEASPESSPEETCRRHFAFGWTVLAIFGLGGIALETLHGFKVSWFLDVGNETRRLVFRLAHAHGTLLGLLNLAFAWSVTRMPEWPAKARGRASGMLRASTVLLPGGFFLGGLKVYGGDPGLGIVLAPIGGLLLVVSMVLTAKAAHCF